MEWCADELVVEEVVVALGSGVYLQFHQERVRTIPGWRAHQTSLRVVEELHAEVDVCAHAQAPFTVDDRGGRLREAELKGVLVGS